MRSILNTALVLGGIFISVMVVSQSPTTAKMDATQNRFTAHGLNIALPSDMKRDFPAQLVPLP
jgi:hypothetical protein